jgi:micrococcal nuclease
MDQSKAGRIRNVLSDRCPGQLVEPWPDAPPDTPTTTTPVPPIQPAIPQGQAGNCDPAYPTVCIPPSAPDLDCGDVPYRRFTVLPPDPHRFDGSDDDGVGCESR